MLVAFVYCAYPLHSEILQREQERAEISTGDFHIVRGEGQAQDFSFVSAVE
jgi:hypothetical protein